MEKLIADTRSGSVVHVGLVIDATGSDIFLHDVKYVHELDWKLLYSAKCLIVAHAVSC